MLSSTAVCVLMGVCHNVFQKGSQAAQESKTFSTPFPEWCYRVDIVMSEMVPLGVLESRATDTLLSKVRTGQEFSGD